MVQVFQGTLAVFVDGIGKAYMLDISNPPHRNPEEPNTKVSIRGANSNLI